MAWLAAISLSVGCSGPEKTVKGTFRNPVIYADVPDISVTRAGEYYYMISTTMHLMPGGPVMRSKDLVNWETVSYVFDKLTDNTKYDLIDGTVYGRGQWASSIRYHTYCSHQTTYLIGRIYSQQMTLRESGNYYQGHSISMMLLYFLMMTDGYMYSMEPVN